jgi:hypothetical protein
LSFFENCIHPLPHEKRSNKRKCEIRRKKKKEATKRGNIEEGSVRNNK